MLHVHNATFTVHAACQWKVKPCSVYIIRSFHEGMYVVVRVGSTATDSIEVQNGLKQGCTIAPTLFNICLSAVVADWRNHDHCPQLSWG